MSTFLTDFFQRGTKDPIDPFETMRREMDRMLSDRFPGFGRFPGGYAPALDVSTGDDHVEITAELPGVSEDDVTLEIDDDVLTLKGEKKAEREEKTDGGAVLTERSYGSFYRSVRLPFAPDPDRVSAKFENGVLTVTAPKPAEIAARSRRIAIGR